MVSREAALASHGLPSVVDHARTTPTANEEISRGVVKRFSVCGSQRRAMNQQYPARAHTGDRSVRIVCAERPAWLYVISLDLQPLHYPARYDSLEPA